ncbi:MAG: Uracil DNA glycosylase superfamily protein [Syntrophus sp. PtaB.Bin001]|jgi:DNA polymerase|nr:MAG: Uracil DNA glycosylase superfamily protein [Syntrophus sp. PtaB.Bin001]
MEIKLNNFFMESNKSETSRNDLLTLVRSLKYRIILDRELRRPNSWLTDKKNNSVNCTGVKPVNYVQKQLIDGKSVFTKEENTKVITLEDIRRDMESCHRCPLEKTRQNLVFGEGNPFADLVFVGEAPGAEEDLQGRPFVGRAGQLLTKIIVAMGLKREDVYICNILKCRPPGNRNPLPEEIEVCEPYLVRQIQTIRPKVICALGTFAAQTLLKKKGIPITALRGQFHDYHGIYLMPTYHPAYLLRNPGAKKQVWEDVQKIMKVLTGEYQGGM